MSGRPANITLRAKQTVKNTIGAVLSLGPRSLQTKFKELNELLYWRLVKSRSNNELFNGHMAHFFTTHFGIPPEHYAGKRILDVGCGPVGTLEWASDARERVGLDPLADKYAKWNRGKHQMRYVKSGSESIPFEDGHFDIVTSFNALDHVEDIERAIAELKRVCKPGGDLLLIVEINHKPTITEPHNLKADFVEKFEEFDVVTKGVCAINSEHNIYGSLGERHPPKDPNEEAILWLHLKKRPLQ